MWVLLALQGRQCHCAHSRRRRPGLDGARKGEQGDALVGRPCCCVQSRFPLFPAQMLIFGYCTGMRGMLC